MPTPRARRAPTRPDYGRIDLAIAESGVVFVFHESESFEAAVACFRQENGGARLSALGADGRVLATAAVAPALAPALAVAPSVALVRMAEHGPCSGARVSLTRG